MRQLTIPTAVPSKRPQQSDRWVARCVAEELYRMLCEELPDDFSADADDREEAIEQLAAVADPWNDGYQIARDLERRYSWDCDKAVADVLDEVSSIAYDAVDQAVVAWVAATKPAPPFQPGTMVVVKHKLRDVVGEIVDVAASDAAENARPVKPGTKRFESKSAERYAARAQYLVYVESLGHVRSGQGTHGLIVAWEDVRLASDVFGVETLDAMVRAAARVDDPAQVPAMPRVET